MPRLDKTWLAAVVMILSGVVDSSGLAQGLPEPLAIPPAAAPSPAPPLGRDDLAAKLKPAPLRPTDRPLPINLATALRLSDARPLVVAAAQASAMVAQAQLERAKVLWIPTLNTGFDYYRHDGGNQDITTGRLKTVSSNFFYAGGGATLIVASTDAIFTPLAARQVLRSRIIDIQTAKNDALLNAATAYFTVHEKRGTYAGAVDAVERARDLVDRIEKLGAGLVPRVEADRARTLLAELEQLATSARADWRVSSANLTRVLRLDPATIVVPLEPDHLPLTLIDPRQGVDELIPIGLTNRPELASQQALVQATLVRLKQERMRPVLPSVLITGFQTPEFLFNGGAFATGSGGSLDQWSGRFDMSYQLVWQLEGFGLGNRARIRERRADSLQAAIELFKVQDEVAAQVDQAQARVESAWMRMEQAERAMREALITYEGNLRGLGETTRFNDILVLVYRPQEVVVALQHLQESYTHYFSTVADYNRAQFQLFHDLGFPSQGLACRKPPGEILPVNTSRPPYLPSADLPPLPH
jgi:outer membrane protein TolC